MSDDDKSNNEQPQKNQRVAADKDTTGQNHKPRAERSVGAHRLAPTGTIAVPTTIKREKLVNVAVQTEETTTRDTVVDLSRNDINHEEQITGINVLLLLADSPHPKGIEGGRISRATLTQGEIGHEKILAHFDCGEWAKKPENPLEIQVLMKVLKEQNGVEPQTVKPAFDEAQKPKLKP